VCLTDPLDIVLTDGLHWFREFLKSEFSEENIEFWIACESYKHLKPHKMAAQAQKIFTQFVMQQAPREVGARWTPYTQFKLYFSPL